MSALRTPIGTAGKGTLRDTTAFDLADHVVRAAAEGLDPEQIDDVILAEGLDGGGVIARHAAITAGLTRPASRSTGTAPRAFARWRPRPAPSGPAWTS